MRNYNLQLDVPVLDGQFDYVINGEHTDTDQTKLPLTTNGKWQPVINLITGRIANWEQGVTADIMIKAVDRGSYFLFDHKKCVASLVGEYVPEMLSVGVEGYGDYIDMYIDETGKIKDFEKDLTEFNL